MRVLVTGGRNFVDPTKELERVLFELKPDVIIHGDATGADALAGNYALNHMVDTVVVPAPFHYMGPWAGMMRNIYMLEHYKPDLVVACNGGPGTENCVRNALLRGIPVRRVP